MTLPYVLQYAPLNDSVVDYRDWLCAAEVAELDLLRNPSRRQQWLAGRWLAKQILQSITGAANLIDVQILTRNDRRQGVHPRICVGSQVLPWSLSISHSERGVLVALATTELFTVGADLVGHVPCNPGFHQLWFTEQERNWIAGDVRRRTAIVWAIKEAIYKASNTGEAWEPRAIEVRPQTPTHFECVYRGRQIEPACLAIHDLDGEVAAVVCLPQAREALTQNSIQRPSHPELAPLQQIVCSHPTAKTHSLVACC